MVFEAGGFNTGHGKHESGQYASGGSGEDAKHRREREKLDALKKKYSQEFPFKTLHAKSVTVENYTQELRDADLEYINSWKEYHIGRAGWLIEELTLQFHQRMDHAKSLGETTKLRSWYFSEKDNLFEEKRSVHEHWRKWHEEIFSTYANHVHHQREGGSKKPGGQSDQGQKQPGGGKEQGPKNPGEKPRRPEGRTESKKSAEQIAIQELGITSGEYQLIFNTSSRLAENQLVSLAERILGVSNGRNKVEVRKAFQRCAREWHPDKNGGPKKVVNEIKFQVANAFYNNKYKSNL